MVRVIGQALCATAGFFARRSGRIRHTSRPYPFGGTLLPTSPGSPLWHAQQPPEPDPVCIDSFELGGFYEDLTVAEAPAEISENRLQEVKSKLRFTKRRNTARWKQTKKAFCFGTTSCSSSANNRGSTSTAGISYLNCSPSRLAAFQSHLRKWWLLQNSTCGWSFLRIDT